MNKNNSRNKLCYRNISNFNSNLKLILYLNIDYPHIIFEWKMVTINIFEKMNLKMHDFLQ